MTKTETEIDVATIPVSELAHYGVKGMRWGVRNDAHAQARARVKAGNGTVGDSHAAAMKTTGHRIANGVLGDKRMWTSMAKIAGVAAAGSAAASFGPGLLPDSFLADVGQSISLTRGVGEKGHFLVKTNDGPRMINNADVGHTMLAGAGITAVSTAGAAAAAATYGSNAVRAIRGNARIRASAETLGSNVNDRQTSGSLKTRRMLMKNGSISRSALKQSDMDSGSVIEHAEGKTVQEFFNALPAARKDTIALFVAAAVEEAVIPPEVDVFSEYNALSLKEQNLIDLIVGNESLSVSHSDDVDDVLTHYGVKGMRWGHRNAKTVGSTGGKGSPTPKGPVLTTTQKRVIAAVTVTGAAATASILAGPTAGMAVSAIGRAVDAAFSVESKSSTTETVTVSRVG